MACSQVDPTQRFAVSPVRPEGFEPPTPGSEVSPSLNHVAGLPLAVYPGDCPDGSGEGTLRATLAPISDYPPCRVAPMKNTDAVRSSVGSTSPRWLPTIQPEKDRKPFAAGVGNAPSNHRRRSGERPLS